ncbi:MAG: prepilin-type N-terminal cleavage/methylation domain-containing protein [Firmicutes bacterium]|nr:prepilin-type N-terminal cleavage/methylation domain-containing protein [Bacillota bacterium]
MKNKGFTLIEVLGVVILIALLLLIVFPNIINFIKKSSDEQDRLTKELIFSAADSYIKDHINNFPKVDGIEDGIKYAIELKDLVDEGLLVSPIKYSDSEDITNDKCVQVTYENNKYEKKLEDECKSQCVLTRKKDASLYTKYGYFAIVGDVVTCGTEEFYVIGMQDSSKKSELYNGVSIPSKHGSTFTSPFPIFESDLNNSKKLALLSKYNLDVGYIYYDTPDEKKVTDIELLNRPTYGLQHYKSVGYTYGENIHHGLIEFSKPLGGDGGNSYWYPEENSSCYNETQIFRNCLNNIDKTELTDEEIETLNGKVFSPVSKTEIIKCDSDKCYRYTTSENQNFCYVYGEFKYGGQDYNNLYPHVVAYEEYLKETLNIKSASATIMSYEQAYDLKAITGIQNDFHGVSTWLHLTTFWLGTAINNTDILGVSSGGSLSWDGGAYLDVENIEGNGALTSGIRPVITISKEDIVVQQET